VYCRTSHVFRYKLSHILFYFIFYCTLFYDYCVLINICIYMYMAAPEPRPHVHTLWYKPTDGNDNDRRLGLTAVADQPDYN